MNENWQERPEAGSSLAIRITIWIALKQRRENADDDVQVGVGAHWGHVFCGAVGDLTRLEFTVLGDTVNVASRLEQLSKTVGRPIIVSEDLLTEAGQRPTEENGWVAVSDTPIRGRRGHVQIFARS